MNLIGTRYATFRDRDLLVKSEDMDVPARLPVRCYREALAVRFGSRLGLAIPRTELVLDARRGRLVVQHWLDDGSQPTLEELDGAVFTATGIRILLLDLLVANTDRRRDNLLVHHGQLIPIDFNVAFAFAGPDARSESPDMTIMRWFGTSGVLALPIDGRRLLDSESDRFEHLVSEAYVHWAIGRIPDAFLAPPERARLLQGLLIRRASIGSWMRDWWQRTVDPLHRLEEAHDD